MPVRLGAPWGAPCWIDLQTSDVEQARSFYSELFGWSAEAPSEEFGGYWMWHLDGRPIAGGMKADAQAPVSDVWSIYLAVENAQKTLELAAEHGGQVVVPSMPVADLGSMAFVIDAAGAGIGLWQPETFPGFGVWDEPGAPAWFELLTRDYTGEIGYYREVFGWQPQTASETVDFKYTVLPDPEAEQGGLAGIMDASAVLPEGVPDHWSVYFRVPDMAAALARVSELGGSVLRPAEPTPFGTLATVADRTGGVFKLTAE